MKTTPIGEIQQLRRGDENGYPKCRATLKDHEGNPQEVTMHNKVFDTEVR